MLAVVGTQTEVIGEQAARIEALMAQVTELSGQVGELRRRLGQNWRQLLVAAGLGPVHRLEAAAEAGAASFWFGASGG